MFPMISSLCSISALLLNQPRRTSSSNRVTWLHQKIFRNFWKKPPDIWIFHKRTVPRLRWKITKKKHIPWKMNGFCTWKSRCCGKGNHLKQTFMTSGASHEFGEGCTWPSPFPPLTKGTQQHNPPTDPLWDFVVIKKTWCNGNFGGSLPKRFILSLGEVFPLNGLAFSISVNGWWFF